MQGCDRSSFEALCTSSDDAESVVCFDVLQVLLGSGRVRDSELGWHVFRPTQLGIVEDGRLVGDDRVVDDAVCNALPGDDTATSKRRRERRRGAAFNAWG
jgi:hypothetical protein